MRWKGKMGYVGILLFTFTMIIYGCSTKLKSESELNIEIAKKIPQTAQLEVISESKFSPLFFQAPVDGIVYYIANGDILLSKPVLEGDIIKLNDWDANSNPSCTIITINDKTVYQQPYTRFKDNRIYFDPRLASMEK